MHPTLLEDQDRVLEEVIEVSGQIIDHQERVREAARTLREENRDLEVRSNELQKLLRNSQHQLENQVDLSIPLEMINKLAGEVRRHKEEQRCRFEELEQLIEMTRSKVDLQMKVVSERALDSRVSSVGEGPIEEAVITNGGLEETEEELAEAGNYIRQLSQPGIQLNTMALVNVRVKSRISAQESSVDEEERMDMADFDSGVTARLESLEKQVTEFITPPRRRSQKKRYEQPVEVVGSPPGAKGLPRQECIDLVLASQPLVRRPSQEAILVDQEDELTEDDRCSASTRELNDEMDAASPASPTCFVTEFGQTEVHFQASDPVDDVGDSL